MSQKKSTKLESEFLKTHTLTGFSILIALLIVLRLFYLQVISGDYFVAQAEKDHQAQTELQARRGEIFIKDHHSGEKFRIATNITLSLVFADPIMIKNKAFVAERITPILFDLEEERKKDLERIEKLKEKINTTSTAEEIAQLAPKSENELYENYQQEILEKISANKREKILLSNQLSTEALTSITNEKITGIRVEKNQLVAYPLEIKNPKETAFALSPYLNIPEARLERLLLGENRYVLLKRKLKPELAEKLREIKSNDPKKDFLGIGMRDEYFRYYPENSLAANLIGFVAGNGIGQYGIEGSFNKLLEGEKGIFQTQVDSTGRHITVGDSIIKPAINGANITLTIDRSIQMELEKSLEKTVTNTRADSGQAIIMDPKTGKIIAMANYPSFNPNNFNEVFETEAISLTPGQIKELIPSGKPDENPPKFTFFQNPETFEKFEVFKIMDENKMISYQKYKNLVGPQAYQNLAVAGIYEPGSVMKSIAMAIGLDAKEITPKTTFMEDGPIQVDEFTIRNSLDRYSGRQTMLNVLENSSNTGMAFIARKVGRTLMYNYYKKFGFGQRTDIEFENEAPGALEHSSNWAESELVTRAFGQGIATTPLQMAVAYSALANKGILMKPYIIEEIETENGEITTTEPKTVQRVIDEETADTITSMMVSAIENGVAKNARVAGHYIAGKTGTSQTYKNGKPLEGPGTTIASIAGFAPADDPKFVILIKVDRPRTQVWADSTVAPMFAEISQFLFKYYAIAQDKT